MGDGPVPSSSQEQLLREVERRHQEKALADTACEALEGKLRKAEDEMHDLLVRGVGGGGALWGAPSGGLLVFVCLNGMPACVCPRVPLFVCAISVHGKLACVSV